MSFSIVADVVNPRLNLIRDDHNKGHVPCYLMHILLPDGSKVVLHFETKDELDSFIGNQRALAESAK